MPSKAGELFICAVCAEPHPEDEAVLDDQLGPVCQCCKLQIGFALFIMKKAGIDREITTEDINPTNINRFQ